MYALNIDKETNRILSATYPEYASEGMPIVDRLPDESDLPEGVVVDHVDITDFQCIDKKYHYNPLPKPEPTPAEPTQLDIIEAQVFYTAMCTDTLLPEESEGEA